jgi:hypothetical protein
MIDLPRALKPRLHDSSWLARLFLGDAQTFYASFWKFESFNFKASWDFIILLAWNVCARFPGTSLAQAHLRHASKTQLSTEWAGTQALKWYTANCVTAQAQKPGVAFWVERTSPSLSTRRDRLVRCWQPSCGCQAVTYGVGWRVGEALFWVYGGYG